MQHAVQDRITHMHVWRRHINFSAKHSLAFAKTAIVHFFKTRKVFFYGGIAVRRVLARFNKITPILCSVMPAYEFGWRKGMEPAGKIIKLNEMIKAYADKHNLVYVDYHSALKDERNGLPAKYSHDEVHPTLEAYKIMESIVQKAIQKVLK